MIPPGYREGPAEQMPFPGWRDSLIEASIATLKEYEPKHAPYWGCFSGGKDSIVIKRLAEMAGVAVEWHYSVTTIDPPELTAYIKRHHPDVSRDKPPRTFVQLIGTKGLPTRLMRWCCEQLKESRADKGRRLILGVRAAESPRRAANWQTFTFHRKTKEYAVCPILHWKDGDVWAFIHEQGLPYCELYDQGYKRLGCIGCPMSRGLRVTDFARWPAIARQIREAARGRWEAMKASGNESRTYVEFDQFAAFWNWWLSDEPMPNADCRGGLDLWSNEDE
jgi:phosphoadenosine phosphosulfate reductase